jgi:hypothetical protein
VCTGRTRSNLCDASVCKKRSNVTRLSAVANRTAAAAICPRARTCNNVYLSHRHTNALLQSLANPTSRQVATLWPRQHAFIQHAARPNRWPPRREETSSRFSCTRWHVQPVTHTHSHQPTCCLLAVHNHLTLWVVYSKRDELASSALDVPRVGDVEEHRVATLSRLWQAPPSHHVDLLLSPSPHTHVRVRIDTFSSLTHPNRKSASAHIGVRSTGQKHQRYGVLMLVVATPHCRHPHTC